MSAAAKQLGGIIPACAGSTGRVLSFSLRERDHPRVRGEHRRSWPPAMHGEGSSPRARGALKARPAVLGCVGIIPACAGSTMRGEQVGALGGDHPRVRGEHSDPGCAPHTRAGSSPRARGAQLDLRAVLRQVGIIPACAGSTTASISSAPQVRDHPRVRGEHTPRTAPKYSKAGSSPRARGAPLRDDPGVLLAGIIPACAGSTS